MKKIKLMLCLLTSHDLNRLTRLMVNLRELIPAPSIELFPIIVVNTINDNYYNEVLQQKFPYPTIRTESNGKPGKGKNSCFDIFLNSSCDYLTQFDGDDILYPTYLQSIENHLNHYPGLDVLGIVPMDIINYGEQLGHKIHLSNNVHAGVWGVSLIHPYGSGTPGPGRNSSLWDCFLPSSWDYIVLQSKKASVIKMDETLGVAEDHLWSIEALSLHQQGKLQYFNTMSSDMFIIDRTTENSVQKIYPQIEYVDDFKAKVLQFVPEYRSNPAELPMIYKDLLMDQYQKEKWIKYFWNKTEILLNHQKNNT
jgi:hypothetical protein